jgi:hypothetical protein
LVAHKLLTENLQPHLDAVCAEFRAVAGDSYSTWKEVQELVAGAAVDVDEWRRRTDVRGFAPGAATVEMWWSLLAEMPAQDQRRVFTFATGYAGWPVGGVRCVLERVEDPRRLPYAATCSLTVHLPEYESKDVLAQKLAWALEEKTFALA